MKDSITAFSIANDIRMTHSQYPGCFVIVEGETADLRVYGRFIDPESCQIIPAHEKERALKALDILENSDFTGVLAIVDADFWRLEGKKPASPNLFITDAHDLEMMMLKSPALEKLLTEFGSANKLENLVRKRAKTIREILLDLGCPLGYLRWTSERQSLSLTFEGIAFSKFIDRRTLTLDVIGMTKTVRDKSGRFDLAEKDLQDAIRELEDVDKHDPWDVCCGHDLMCILSLGFRAALGSNKTAEVKPDLLEKSLRLAYEAIFFFGTELFQSLKAWEATNRPFRIFPPTLQKPSTK